MEYFLIFSTFLIILYGKKKNWNIVFLAWLILHTLYVLSLDKISTELIVLGISFIASYTPYLFYNLYYRTRDESCEERGRFLSGLIVTALLFLMGIIFILVSKNQALIDEMLTEVQIKNTTIFQLMNHYEQWGSIVTCMVIFCFAGIIYSKQERVKR